MESRVGPGLTFTYTAAEIQGLARQPSTSAAGGASKPELSGPLPSGISAIEALVQHAQAVPLPKERPRVRGRMTPYAFFVQQRREFYRQQGLPVQFTPFSKECSALWRTMAEEEKMKYQRMAEEDRERYRREISGDSAKPLAKDGTRRGRKKKEPGQPKRNMCAFLHFCSEKRPKLKQENPSFSVGALAKQLSAAWKLMTAEQKKPYDEMAGKDKQRYEQQKQAYEAGYSAAYFRHDLPTSGLLGQVTPRGRRRRKDPDMPKRNMSAFMFYSLAKRPEIKAQNPSFGVGKLAQRLAEHWRTMDATQKEPYAAKAREDRERYSVQLKAYKKGWGGGGAPQTLDSQKEAKDPEKERSPQEEDEGEEEEEEEGEEGGEEEEGEGKEGEGEVDKEAQLGGRVGVDSELEQLCEFYQ